MKRARVILTVIPVLFAASTLTADDAIFEAGAKPKLVLENGAGEGPAWHPKHGLLFTGAGGINRLTERGKLRPFRSDAGSNGLLFDREGRLLVCEPVRRLVSRLDANGKLTVLTDNYKDKKYNQPNDITVDSKGRIYFSDPRYGSRADMQIVDEAGKKIEGVYRIDPDGTVTRVITHEADRPNGLLVSADDRYLFVADNNNDTAGGARKLWRFDLKRDGDVDLKSRKLLFDWGGGRGPDGLVSDVQGRLYVAGGLEADDRKFETNKHKAGVYVFSPDGKLLDFVRTPRDESTNCTFGGNDLKTLYITAGGTLWSIRTTTPGRVLWPAPK